MQRKNIPADENCFMAAVVSQRPDIHSSDELMGRLCDNLASKKNEYLHFIEYAETDGEQSAVYDSEVNWPENE
jgi:hypothetical protein